MVAKFVALLAVTLVVMLVRSPVLNVGIMVALVVVGLSARLRVAQLLLPVRRMWLIFLIFGALQLLLSDWVTAVRVITVMATCVLAANVLMLSTPLAALLELFRWLVTPCKFVGLNPEIPALAAALMVRSVPYLADLADVAKDAASARGLEGSVRARLVPVALGAVKYAQDTGRALDARGILD